ncbi:MAG: undecaprenyldiphospho-muramoylpentapeptide beta-N-acetylglucosaminyltransferase [Alphaproteobacteria bacterium]|nr:MAG: undecaprenyldiphospho-muramoylpentapeptide beta-N-acetylglucosaminyltransferase [Alphaproteobacteria bacterium]
MTGICKNVVLASGGTGGHIFPARALAEELTSRGFSVTLMTDGRGTRYEELFPGVDVMIVKSGSPSIGGPIGKVRAILSLAAGFFEARAALRKLQPFAVVGFGGYPSMPPAAAAASLKIPLVLHEQNAVLGRVNRLLSRYARAIATSFARTESRNEADHEKMVFTGNPVRRAILALANSGYAAPNSDAPIRLLILGGSQGATVLSDVVPGALVALPEDLRARLDVTQQCRPEDIDRVTALYREAGIKAMISSFFENVDELLKGCHLAITRSGASTLAELTVVGRPSLLVPFKHAMDDHQRKNAENAVGRGAARLILQDDFTIESASQDLAQLLSHPNVLKKMAAAASEIGELKAAEKLADLVVRFAPANNDTNSNGKAAA